MARNYIANNVEFEMKNSITVNMILPDGSRVDCLEPHRLFPMNSPDEYISLLDADGKEQGIIKKISDLSQKSAEIIRSCLNEYYIMPKITEVIEVYEKGSVNRWTVMTDKGKCSFQIRARYSDIKPFPSGRVLIRDTNDNRYEIVDVKKLSKHSLAELNSQI